MGKPIAVAGGSEEWERIPKDVAAEEALLASCLIDDDAYWEVMAAFPITPSDFYRERNANIWRAIQTLNTQMDAVNTVSVSYELSHLGQLDSSGGQEYLGKLVAELPTSVHAVGFAESVWRQSRRRRIILEAGRLAQGAYDAGLDIDEELAGHYRRLAELDSWTGGLQLLADIFKDGAPRLEKFEEDPTELDGIPTGFRDLDVLLRGWQRGDLIFVAARPSVGKSQLAVRAAYHAAMHVGPVALFSLEMAGLTLGERILAMRANISPSHVRTRGWMPEEKARWRAALEEAKTIGLWIDQTRNLNTAGIWARVTRQMAAHPSTCLIVIDYLHLVEEKSDNEVTKLGTICKSLRSLAGRFDVPVLLVGQLNRSPESRKDVEPKMSDSRGSGEIEQIVDVGLLLQIPDKKPNTLRILIAKNRNGPTGSVDVYYDRATGRMEDLRRDPQ